MTLLIITNIITGILTWRITTWWYDHYTETYWEFDIPEDEEEDDDEY